MSSHFQPRILNCCAPTDAPIFFYNVLASSTSLVRNATHCFFPSYLPVALDFLNEANAIRRFLRKRKNIVTDTFFAKIWLIAWRETGKIEKNEFFDWLPA